MKLNENDYLTYQLYTASKSPVTKKSRNRQRWWITFIFAGLAFLLFSNENQVLGYYFLACSILTFLFFPAYSKGHYKRHYLKHIRHHFKNLFENESNIHFEDDFIYIKSNADESKINLTEIEVVNEIADYYFLQLKSGRSIIIPKYKTTEGEDLSRSIKSLIEQNRIPHNIELDWKWK